MTSQLLLDKADLGLTVKDNQDQDNESTDNITSYHDCLAGSYMSYLKAAGYSKLPQEMRIFERGAQTIPPSALLLAPLVISCGAVSALPLPLHLPCDIAPLTMCSRQGSYLFGKPTSENNS